MADGPRRDAEDARRPEDRLELRKLDLLVSVAEQHVDDPEVEEEPDAVAPGEEAAQLVRVEEAPDELPGDVGDHGPRGDLEEAVAERVAHDRDVGHHPAEAAHAEQDQQRDRVTGGVEPLRRRDGHAGLLLKRPRWPRRERQMTRTAAATWSTARDATGGGRPAASCCRRRSFRAPGSRTPATGFAYWLVQAVPARGEPCQGS